MPSNYTIAQIFKRIVYYKEICGLELGKFPGATMEIQSLSGIKLEELYNTNWSKIRQVIVESDEEVVLALEQIIRGDPVTALKQDKVPLSILELTEIKGVGGKTARKVYDELKVVDLNGLKAALEDGRLAKVRAFGPAMIEKVKAHIAAVEEKKKKLIE